MGIIGLILSVLSIVCVWMFDVEFIWKVTVTVFASIELLASVLRLGIAFGQFAKLEE